MSSLLIYILLIAIWNSILFFNNSLGINVMLFIIPITSFITYVLLKNKKVKNKKGLLLIAPIILLSASYLIYNNGLFKVLNVFAISVLLALLYVYTINPVDNLLDLISDVFWAFVKPFKNFGNIIRLSVNKIANTFKLSKEAKKKIVSFLIIIPITIIIIVLLSSADLIFKHLFSNIFNIIGKVIKPNLIFRIIFIILLFIYTASTISYLLYDYKERKKKKKTLSDNYTIKVLLIVLNVVYIIFDFIQIKSLMLHKISMDISYASYARSGFFQLMVISLINLSLILISKKVKEDKFINIMNVIMILLTLIIIGSSIYRVYMYESAYGYTTLRLLVYVILFTEIILLVPTIIYVFNPKFKILNYYLIITMAVYTILSLSPIDYVIAKNNIDRYYHGKKFDLEYLENYKTDNVSLLIDLKNNTKDKDIKNDLAHYLKSVSKMNKTDSVFEYNISKEKAIKEIKNNE